MSDIIDMAPSTGLARQDRSSVLLMPVMNVAQALERLKEFQTFCASYLQESQDGGQDGGDYGVIPGTKKKTLLKSGAEKLCEIYGLADDYEAISSVENWDIGLFDYTLKCILKSRRDDSIVGTGVGSCSTFESKYRWRDQQKTCPICRVPAIIRGKNFKTGGSEGWLCWKKKAGCGATFKDGDKAIEDQPVGRIENPDIIDAKNTALKMAKKRAKIDAVIGVTRSSGIFTQDMEDLAAPAPVVRPEPSSPVQSPLVAAPTSDGAFNAFVVESAKRKELEDSLPLDQHVIKAVKPGSGPVKVIAVTHRGEELYITKEDIAQVAVGLAASGAAMVAVTATKNGRTFVREFMSPEAVVEPQAKPLPVDTMLTADEIGF